MINIGKAREHILTARKHMWKCHLKIDQHQLHKRSEPRIFYFYLPAHSICHAEAPGPPNKKENSIIKYEFQNILCYIRA